MAHVVLSDHCRPKRLWILNPGLILKQDLPVGDLESKPLLSTHSKSGKTQYQTMTVDVTERDDDTAISGNEGCCWVCLGNDDPKDLFYPCNCQLHRKCIKQWVAKRASDVNLPDKEYMKCQVCRKKYHVKNDGFLCFSRGMKRSHWVQLIAAAVFLACSVVGLVLFGTFSSISTNKKALIICGVAICEAVIVKLLAIRMALVLRRTTHVGLEIQGYTVAQWQKRKQRKMDAQERLHKPFTPLQHGSVNEGTVYLSATNSTTGRGKPAIDISVSGSDHLAGKSRNSAVHSTVSVDITPTSV